MGFKQISTGKRGVIVFFHDEEKSQRLAAKKTGTSRNGVQGGAKAMNRNKEFNMSSSISQIAEVK